jgi:hypothetical protein
VPQRPLKAVTPEWREPLPSDADVETLAERLQRLALLGRPVAVHEPPLLLAEVWARARADGLPVSQLYVLGEPLEPYVRGAYNRRTGDVWVLLQEGAEVTAAESLLHELAHAQRQHPPATSIDDDWEEEAEVYRMARCLAERWGHPELLPEERLAQAVSECWDLAEDALVAGELAGTQEPWLARLALAGVRGALAERGLGGLRLSRVVWDSDGPPEARRAAILFPRHQLRGRWSLPFRPGGSLGPLALDASERALDVLWHTLAGVVERHPAVAWRRSAWAGPEDEADAGDPFETADLELRDERALAPALAAAQQALLAYPQQYARGALTVYGDAVDRQTARWYHLEVAYGHDIPSAHVWVLATPERAYDLTVEAAFQMYLLTWAHRLDVRPERLAHGIRAYRQVARLEHSAGPRP